MSRGLKTRITQTPGDRVVNKMNAYWAGKNPTMTIPNPNKEDTSRPFIRVSSNTLWGHPKDRFKKMAAAASKG